MKKTFLYPVFILTGLILVLSGCVKDERITLADVEVWPLENFVTQVHFVSKLTDAAMGATEADYTAVNNYFTATLASKNDLWLGIIDRTDVVYNGANQVNPVLKGALDSRHWTYFAFNKITGGNNQAGTFEGSTMFVNAPVITSTAYKVANDCYISGPMLNLKGKRGNDTLISFDVLFRTIRIDKPEHLTAFGGSDGVFSKLKLERINFLMIGTVKKSLIDQFHSTMSNTNEAFKLAIVEGTENKDYAIFILGEEHFWKYAGASSVSLGNGIEAYTINMNW
jgi:hypothetical protein